MLRSSQFPPSRVDLILSDRAMARIVDQQDRLQDRAAELAVKGYAKAAGYYENLAMRLPDLVAERITEEGCRGFREVPDA